MIFCVEDDADIRDLMIYTLNAAGYEAKGFADGQQLHEALKTQTPRLILLDIMLPGQDGITVLKGLKKDAGTAKIPVIMETARGSEYDKVIGLDLGADDYLAKPFGMMEMVSRVRAVLRRSEPEEAEKTLRVGDLTINTAEHTVFVGTKRVWLTRKEYDLLKIFMQNPGHVFTRDKLLCSVWGDDYITETRTVDVHIGTLRTKLGVCGEYIETMRGIGYRLEARV